MDGFSKAIGKPIPQAEAEINKLGYTMRVVKKDGISFPSSTPYSGNVINVEVVRGIVVNILGVG